MIDQEWEDRGDASHRGELLRSLMDPPEGTEYRHIYNVKTDMDFVVYVEPKQTLAEAIANGQMRRLEPPRAES